MKKYLKHFFLETKTGKYIMKSLSWLNTLEGVIHLIVAGIGAWGLIDISAYDIRAWTPVVENFVFGIFSILTGWALGIDHHHH
ncbi:hypothetical protein Kirov_118 [Bacillus phage Kirov]|uniref:Uncharacterized protein n=1 Tax=Bacillus phage Kirov TaxID=2783539 RepID=A0A7U3RX18_9CAUD|nr:hypothetical protein PQE67_gp186 [Bacillus phage Kirov]QOV08317.1 hypothetical protein Kirov_118 [Bacillus phage Kirov]